MCVWVVARLPQRLKSMFFEKISSLRVSFGGPSLEKNLKNIDFRLQPLRQTVHCPAKMDFFPRFSSMCTYTKRSACLNSMAFFGVKNMCRQYQIRSDLTSINHNLQPFSIDTLNAKHVISLVHYQEVLSFVFGIILPVLYIGSSAELRKDLDLIRRYVFLSLIHI